MGESSFGRCMRVSKNITFQQIFNDELIESLFLVCSCATATNADTERKVSDLSVEELKKLVSEIVEDSIEKCEVTGTMEGRSKLNLKVEGTVIGKMECNFDKKNLDE